MSAETQGSLDNMDLADVYAAASAVGAERVVLILREVGVDAESRESSVAGFPAAGTARHLIVVPGHQRAQAVDVIRQAIEDEILPGEGTLLT